MRYLFILTAVLILGGGLALAIPPESASLPPLVASPQIHAAGQIPIGSEPEAVFEIRNHSSSDIFLRQIYAECDCTFDMPMKATIKAGQVYELKARYTGGGDAGEEIHEIITILSDHPDQPSLLVEFTGKIVALKSCDPARMGSPVRERID